MYIKFVKARLCGSCNFDRIDLDQQISKLHVNHTFFPFAWLPEVARYKSAFPFFDMITAHSITLSESNSNKPCCEVTSKACIYANKLEFILPLRTHAYKPTGGFCFGDSGGLRTLWRLGEGKHAGELGVTLYTLLLSTLAVRTYYLIRALRYNHAHAAGYRENEFMLI
jgi:hypothetical protein